MKFNILVITDRYYPCIGGVEKIAQEVAEGLIKNDIEIVILTRRQTENVKSFEEINGVSVYRINTPFFNWYNSNKEKIKSRSIDYKKNKFIRLIWSVYLVIFYISFTLLKKLTILGSVYFIPLFFYFCKRCDIVHIHRTNTFISLFVFLAKLLNKKVVVTFHASVPSEFELFNKKAVINWPINHFIRNKVFFICAANYLKDFLIKKMHFDERRIFLISNAVEVPSMEEIKESKRRKEDVVISIGRLCDPEKDISTLLKAWRIVKEKDSDANLYIVGDGPDSEKMKTLSYDLGIQNSVIFIGETHNVQSYIKISKIFCLPSRTESRSLSLLECMSWSLSCIVSNIPGSRELIYDYFNGLVFEVGDHIQLAERILFLLKNPSKSEEFGIRARQAVEKEYDIGQSVQKHIDLYHHIMNVG